MKRLYILVLALTIAGGLHAQRFGGFPPSIRWKQINTDTARIIFPSAVDSQAQRVSAIIHKMITLRPTSLGTVVRKISVVLHNNTTLANGYVALAPFRSEFYLVPGSNIFEFGANPWYQELAVHEFRHVHQFSNFNRGLSKVAGVILGQEGQALFNAIAIPGWFWEGDATHTETALTPQGRGRAPYFFNGYKALWREGRNYSWMKLRNGSLKDFVPDHYQLGYLLVNYGYLKYGNEFWGKVTADAAAFKGLIYPFQQAIKRHSGSNYKTFRKEAFDYYSHEVSRKRTDLAKRETVTNYYFPQLIGEDSLLYIKSSYNELPAFYLKDKDKEQRLLMRNITTEDWFSYRNGLIAYTGYEANARWSLIDYSSIFLFDLATKKQTRLTNKGKYYTPDISPSGQQIIAVSVNDSTATYLQLLDRNGNLIKTVRPIAHENFIHPRFIDENTVIVTERLANSTMQMSQIDLLSGRREILIPSTSALIGFPFYYQGSIYFVSSAAGNDEIYSLRLADKIVFQISSGGGGKYFPSVYKDSLTWSVFTSNGMQLQRNAASVGSTNSANLNEITLPYPIADITPNILAELPRKFEVSKYRQGSHLFNFHSWRPNYVDPEFSLSLLSDNIMGTFTNELYYRYNQNETSHAFGFNSSYGGWFPIINSGVEYNINRTLRDTAGVFNINQLEARIGYNIPLNFTSGKLYRFFNLRSNFVFHQRLASDGVKDPLHDRTFYYLHNFVSWSHFLPRARQHINTKFGYTLSAAYRNLLNEKGFQFIGGTSLFLPSFGNHSIVLNSSWQETDTSNRTFSNRFANSRGYDDYFFSRMWKWGANYHFPLVYPDRGIPNIIFIQRVRGNLFYDFTKVYSRNKQVTRNLRSLGTEIFFDTKIWNELPVSFGFRMSYLLDNGFSSRDRKGNTWFEFVLPLGLIPD